MDNPRQTPLSSTNTRDSGSRNDPGSAVKRWRQALASDAVVVVEQLGLRLVGPGAVLLGEDAEEPVAVHLEQHADAGGAAGDRRGNHPAGGIQVTQHPPDVIAPFTGFPCAPPPVHPSVAPHPCAGREHAATRTARATWAIILAESLLWGAYGIGQGDPANISFGVVGTVAAAAILARTGKMSPCPT